MRLLLLFTFSIALLRVAYAQIEPDSTDAESRPFITTDSTSSVPLTDAEYEALISQSEPQVPEKVKILNIAFSFDYGKALTTIAGLSEKYEFGTSIVVAEHYHLIGELGNGILEPENAFRNGTYKSDGHYFRVGGGYLSQFNPSSKLGLSVLYASSKFEDQGTVFLRSDAQDDFSESFSRRNLEARWWEMMITSESRIRFNKNDPKANINSLFALGFRLRLRFLTSYDNFELYEVYTIPGYGRTVNDPQLAANLYIKIYPFGF